MQKRLSIACTLAVLGEANWLDFKIDIDGKEKTKTIKSKQWSQIEVMDQDHYALVPNNNSFALQNRPRVDEETFFKPYLRGGSIQYTVDLSALDCGCVAGVYAVTVNKKCDPKYPSRQDSP